MKTGLRYLVIAAAFFSIASPAADNPSVQHRLPGRAPTPHESRPRLAFKPVPNSGSFDRIVGTVVDLTLNVLRAPGYHGRVRTGADTPMSQTRSP